jgi:hypothetical protein
MMIWLKTLYLRSIIRRLERELAVVNRQIAERSAVLQSPYRRRAEIEQRLGVAVRSFDELREHQRLQTGTGEAS